MMEKAIHEKIISVKAVFYNYNTVYFEKTTVGNGSKTP
jgi:hypothetical protein